jgi:hypothetical protein
MDKSIVANDDRYLNANVNVNANANANDGGDNLPISMIPCPDCENSVPTTNLELRRLRACPSNSEINGNNGGRYRETTIPAVNPATSTNIFAVGDKTKTNGDEEDDDDDDDSVVVMATMPDSPSRRPRKTRRGNIINIEDTMVQSSSSPEEAIDSNYNNNGNDNANDNSNQNNEEDEIIDLMDESDISSDPLRRVDASIGADLSARTVDLTANSEEDEDDAEDDRKLPARDTTTDSNRSDNNRRSDDEWSCPQCTLFNKNDSFRCVACQYFNSELQHRLNRSASTAREDHTMTYPQQQPVSAPSSLSFIGSGALLGAAVGMAGNYMHGRNPLSGAFEGGTTGAMGGALLHEVLQNNNNSNTNNNNNNSDHERATALAPAGAPAYTRRNHDVIDITSTRSLSHYVEGGTISRNSSSSNYSNATPARYSTSTGGSGYPTANTRNDSMNESTNSDVSPSAARSYRPRPQANNNPNTYAHLMSSAINRDRGGEARMNLLLYQQLQSQDNRDRASFGVPERNLSGEYSSTHIFRQFRTLQLLRELNTRGDQNDIDEMNYEELLNAFGDGTENMGAEESEIRRLPTHVVGDNPLPEDARQCLICLEDFEKGESRTILPCLHGFHQNCCNKWLRTNGKCPVCKHPIASNG